MTKPLSSLLEQQNLMPLQADPGKHPSAAPHSQGAAANETSDTVSIMAACPGPRARRLQPHWPRLLTRLSRLGPTLFVTRHGNNSHERVLRLYKITLSGNIASIHEQDGSLELDTSHWHSGFVLYSGDVPQDTCLSLHFFDLHGQLLHSIYPTLSCSELGSEFLHGLIAVEQSMEAFLPPPLTRHKRSYQHIDATSLLVHWQHLRSCQAIPVILQKHQATRWQALRVLPPEFAKPLQRDACLRLLQQASAQGLEMELTLFTPGITQTHQGSLENNRNGKFSSQSRDAWFQLQLDTQELHSAWIVHKPAMDGMVSSLEAYDAQDELVFILSGSANTNLPQKLAWQRLLHHLGETFAL